MKGKRKMGLVIVGLGVASFLALTGFRNHEGGPEGFMGKRLEKMLTKIEATPEQRARIEAIRDRLVAERPKRGGDRGELLELWKQESPDAAAIHAKLDQKFEEQRAFAGKVADALIEVHGVLTPEQRVKVAAMMEKGAHEGRGKRKGPGHRMRGAPDSVEK